MARNAQIELRGDTAANWTSANPVLAIREVGLELDTRTFKVGDGSTAWASLTYWPAGGGGGGSGTVTSVALTAPSGLTVTGSPITSAGTLAITTTLNGYVKGNGSGFSAVATIPATDLSGTLAAAQFPALTGDVTTTAGSLATTIAAGSVTLAKMANVATATVFYRKTAGTGVPEVQTLATLKTDLGLTGTNSGDYTVSSVSASYTETATLGEKVVLVTATGQTITLPTAVGNKAKLVFKLMVTGNLTIDGAGTETIDGGLTATLLSQYESITLVSDNANWMVI